MLKRVALWGVVLLALTAVWTQGSEASRSPRSSDPRVAEAIKEGQLIVYASIFETPATQKAHRDAFLAYWGLPDDFEIRWDIRPTNAILGTLEAEAAAGRTRADVVAMPALNWFFEAAERGLLMAYDSPEYKYFEVPERLGLNNRPYWVSDLYVFMPMWNSLVLPGLEIESWMDLLAPELRGQMSIIDGAVQPSAAMAYGVLKDVLPLDFWQRLAKQDIAFVAQSSLAQEMMLTGERPVSIFGVSADAIQLHAEGATFVKTSFPKEGVLAQPMTMAILAQAPHPNAAMLWIDFLRSHEGQIVFSRNEGRVPGRSGVPSPNPQIVPNADELAAVALSVDYRKMATDPGYTARLQEDFAKQFGR